MTPLRIVCVGRLKESYWKDAQSEYVKRLSRLSPVEVVELEDEKEPASRSPALMARVKDAEGARILGRLAPGDYVLALCVGAKQPTSEGFAAHLAQLHAAGHGQVTLVIGGSLGLSDAVLARADEKLGLSEMTLPHQLCRVVLLEQLYRAAKINAGERYHK